MQKEDIVKLRCPRCGRYLAEGTGYLRAICRDCGAEASYRSRQERAVVVDARLRVLTAS